MTCMPTAEQQIIDLESEIAKLKAENAELFTENKRLKEWIVVIMRGDSMHKFSFTHECFDDLLSGGYSLSYYNSQIDHTKVIEVK